MIVHAPWNTHDNFSRYERWNTNEAIDTDGTVDGTHEAMEDAYKEGENVRVMGFVCTIDEIPTN